VVVAFERGDVFRNFFTGVAISTLTFLSVAFVPFFGSIILLQSPLPILYYYSKNGRLQGSAVFIVSLIAVAVVLRSFDLTANLPILFVAGCLGIIISEVLKKSYSIEITILFPVVVLLIVWSSFVLYESTRSGLSPWNLIRSYVDFNIQDNIQLYAKLDVPDETLGLIRDNARQIADFFMNIFPSIALISATFAVWINILSGREIFRKNSLSYPDFGDLSCWKSPDKMVWLLIASGGMLLIPVEWIRFSGLNLLIACLFIYLLQGLAIVSFFFRRKNVPRLLRMMFYFFIFAQQYFSIVIVAAGLFDLWVDFRKYVKPATD
jgi:uncharacterized protein YybS (DUF2232 family)